MKKKTLSKVLALVLILSILLSMTGCEALDYRKAVEQYNIGNFDAAAQSFSALGEYEDSRELAVLSQYWAALTRMEKGKFSEALPLFLELGDYEDSPQRVTECQYQMAAALFEKNDVSDAEALFLELGDYKASGEYLRKIYWQMLYEALPKDGLCTETSEGMQLRIVPQKGKPNQLTFSVSRTKDMGYTFYDDLTLTLTRDSLEAEFAATSTFTMDFHGEEIGSQQIASGTVDISVHTPGEPLPVTSYELPGTDNHGNAITGSDQVLMADTMAENLNAILMILPSLLESNGIPQTLQDIGFAPLA